MIRGQARKIKRERERERMGRNAECEKCQLSGEYLALATPEQCRTGVLLFYSKSCIKWLAKSTRRQITPRANSEVPTVTDEPAT